MLLKACSKCGALIPYGRSRCSECEAQREQDEAERDKVNARRYNRRRKRKADPKFKAFYQSKAWRDLSRYLIGQADYRCEDCGGIATEVHHEPPIQTEEGWHRRLDPEICHAVCIRCHNKRHERF